MKRLIGALILIAGVVALVSLLLRGNGYALLGYGAWTVEGSLATFILADLALFFALYFAIRTLARLWSVPERWQGWRRGRQKARGHAALANGLLDLAAGNWKSAEQKLLKHVDISEQAVLNYLGAARSAQEQGNLEQRDSYLKLAQDNAPAMGLAVPLTQAELQLGSGQLEQALATLMRLREISPRHSHVLRLLQELQLRREDWLALQQLLPEMEKGHVLDKQKRHALEEKVYVGLMDKAVTGDDGEEPDRLWKQLPKSLRSQAQVVSIYARYLMDKGESDAALHLLGEVIAKGWDEGLVELYGLAEGTDGSRQMGRAESWLREHQRSTVLLLALARICLRARLWGKARSYLEASIGITPTAEAHQELGVLLEQMGETESALANYKAGLTLSDRTTDVRSWVYDGRKVQDTQETALPSDLRQPLDAPLPVADESS